jgi:hypothetical protein
VDARRLASWRGYGAGVVSPGWYHHLFTAPTGRCALAGRRWPACCAARAADLQRARHRGGAAGRALATLRGRPLAGLAEVTEATRAVLCDGDELRWQLVNRRLVVGERLGAVPDDMPACRWPATWPPPSAACGCRRRRWPRPRPRPAPRHRPRPQPAAAPAAAARRAVGRAAGAARGKGTFWESWRLAGEPEFAST